MSTKGGNLPPNLTDEHADALDNERNRLRQAIEAESQQRATVHAHAVLLVGEDGDGRDAIRGYLRVAGATDVRETNDGVDGLRQLRDGFTPCLIVLDLPIADHDGREFMRVRAADAAFHAIPLVIVSGAPEPTPPLVGVVDYLFKPVGLGRLGELLTQRCSATRR